MNILILVRDFMSGSNIGKNGMPEKSGAEIHVERHARAFVKQGHGVTIMAKKRLWKVPVKEWFDGIKLIRLISGFRSYMCIFYLIKHRKDLDALYVFRQPSFNLTAIWVANLLGIPVTYVSTMTGEAFETIKSDRFFGKLKPYRRMHDYILKKCNHLIAISQEIGNEFIAHGLSPQKVHVLPQGVDLSHYKPVSQEEKRELRIKLQMPEDKCLILFCSRLDYRKGIDLLLEQWTQIDREFPNADLIIAGGGAKEYQQKIDEMIKTGNRIHYVGEVDDPKEYYQLADIFILPSRREGCPNVLMEAMACGCAPVVSKIGGCEDLVADGLNGRVFAKDNAKEMADALRDLLRDSSCVQKYSENSIKLCREKLDVNHVASELVKIFRMIEK